MSFVASKSHLMLANNPSSLQYPSPIASLGFHAGPVRSPWRSSIAVPLGEVLLSKAVLFGQIAHGCAWCNELEALAAVDDVWHNRDRSLIWGVVGAEVWLDRWCVLIPRRVDADGNVCLKAEAGLADVWVPLVELSYGEVVERFGDGKAGIR